MVYFSGVIGSDPATGAIAEGGMVEQFAQAVRNVAAVGKSFRSVFGNHYPAMTFLVVSGLFDPRSMVEIDGVAAVTTG